ncbi:MAG: non-heme iron oxygenase ferredoxin subunit [Gemmatimonadales bacterium]
MADGKSMNEQGFARVAAVADIPEETPYAAALPNGDPVCLVRDGDTIYAFEDRCTHADFPLSDGDLVDECVIECALHGAQFDIRNGEVLEQPATERLNLLEVEVEDGAVWVKLGV